MFLAAMTVQAQISIGGSIYGGGNAGDTGGSSKVTIYAGNLHAVFAGARMANVSLPTMYMAVTISPEPSARQRHCLPS